MYSQTQRGLGFDPEVPHSKVSPRCAGRERVKVQHHVLVIRDLLAELPPFVARHYGEFMLFYGLGDLTLAGRRGDEIQTDDKIEILGRAGDAVNPATEV